jgi:hypothetical protein
VTRAGEFAIGSRKREAEAGDLLQRRLAASCPRPAAPLLWLALAAVVLAAAGLGAFRLRDAG